MFISYIQKNKYLIGAIVSCFLLVGCGQTELYSNLQEKQANQMMALLLERGIACEKTAGAENTYILSVNKSYFAQAIDILNEYGYPESAYQGVGATFQKTGLVSSPTEERIRFMYALSQDIAATLALIDGVLDAQVHIVLPNNNPFVQEPYPSSAAVFISYRPDSNVEATVSQIKNLVMNSVEGLSYDKISVALFPVMLRQTITQPATHSTSSFFVYITFIALIVLLILGAAGYALWRFKPDWLNQKAPPPAL